MNEENVISIKNEEGRLVVSSREIANHFKKQHKHVLDSINNIINKMNCSEKYFKKSFYKDPSGKSNKQYLLTREGVSFYVSSLRNCNKQAVEWLIANGFQVLFTKGCKETETLSIIESSFYNYRSIRQYNVDKYRIDLYFPDLKLAIECDEFGHADRDIEYEVERQKYIQNKLNCKFIRFNPDEKNFNIGSVIYNINTYLNKNKLNLQAI